MKRDHLDYLDDLIDACRKAIAFTKGIDYPEFRLDERTNYAVVRALEIVGEAVKQLPEEMRNRHPDVPWSAMAAMRDKLIHGYFGVELSIVWETAKDHLPRVVDQLEMVREKEIALNEESDV